MMQSDQNPHYLVYHQPSGKNYKIPYWYEEYNSWKDFIFFARQKYPWTISSTIRCKWMDTLFWVGLDTTIRVPTSPKLHYLCFAYELMDHPVWITMGYSREEAISHMLWAISDTIKHFRKKGSAEETRLFLKDFYSTHGIERIAEQ